ncbi:EEF1A lysine methyltransferase 2 [Selaginella moellendorffii]|uniref:EEF1A lysine methyltransferase 2 n=1 Tax=Selaginella moellendorffii TaxID=88036 RepID=UPI000D1C7ABB|nr:EEF1A lysine methyltransferase 2 [Selaginella moellendorffii]XP_024542469.1 EEF1A lysine methyltransferase 2 [Selaginella moellendorffii]|eukprot:XP_024528377.1 EEF1A lysine methyltransferase 2 [Selaginella moellendorffii]
MELPDGAFQASDDDLSSVAADSWSVRSEYGSVLDADELVRQAESVIETTGAQDSYSSCKDEEESLQSVLGLQSHWNSTYADELNNFYAHGDRGEIWFGESVTDTVARWTARLCAATSTGTPFNPADGPLPAPSDLTGWSVLDVGTGNGVFLHAFYRLGFTDLTGIDYSEGAIELAIAIAQRNGLADIKFLVDDLLETNLKEQYRLVTDKGTLDAIGLHPEGQSRRLLYWKSISQLVAPGGILVVTSCNKTKDELVNEATNAADDFKFEYMDHIRSYPTFRFAGVEGSRVSTVAFLRKA